MYGNQATATAIEPEHGLARSCCHSSTPATCRAGRSPAAESLSVPDDTSVQECPHENIRWLSGEEGVVISLNGDVAAECLDCGVQATLAD